MNILCIGDVVGSAGCEFLRVRLPGIKKLKGVDLVVANGENSADGNGVTPSSANFLFDSGVNVITLGNHSFRRAEIYDYLEQTESIVRPDNFPAGAPGRGICIYDMGRIQVAVVNIMGQVYIDSIDCPFRAIDRILEQNNLPKIVIVDFHGEATGEKRAFGFYTDGRVGAVFGTHTHVPTADECILPGGTGYISDAGMTGTIQSVLGVKPELVIKKLKTKLPVRFDLATGGQRMDCVLFDMDEKSGLCRGVQRFSIDS